MSSESERSIQNKDSQRSEAVMFEPLPILHTPHQRRKLILWAGIALATLDLCWLPITYYYALKFGTNLRLQDGLYKSTKLSDSWLIHPSLRCHHGSVWPTKLHALQLSISQAIPFKNFVQMEASGLDEMGNGESRRISLSRRVLTDPDGVSSSQHLNRYNPCGD